MSETLLNNPLRFENNPYHNLVLKERKVLEISGVKQIESFDNNEFLLESSQGWMVVTGRELTLGKLDTERGELIIKGEIDDIHYISNKKSSDKEPFFKRLFK